MSIVGIFTQSRPRIGGLVFDATLEEATELQTDVTQFPIESGAMGHDHAVQRPLRITMRVGVSDNPARALAAQATDAAAAPLRTAGSFVGGAALSAVPESVAVAAGLGASIANAAYSAGQPSVRSQSALDAVRDLQRVGALVNVVALKREYQNCIITNTRQETNKENEQSLELVVEMQQLIVVSTPAGGVPVPAPNDDAAFQAQPPSDIGLVVPR